MSISSISDSYLTSLYTSLLSNANSATATTSKSISTTDSVTLSKEATQLPPPPDQMDFESLTEEELKNYLNRMYAVTGSLPGGTEGTVDSLSAEALEEVRGILIEMSNSTAPTSDSSSSSQMTGEDLKSMLSMLILSMQSGLTGSDSDSDSLFPALTGDYLMQALTGLASSNEDEESSSLIQQALTAYQSNIMSI